jgi:PAS domain S-box-containing protein
MNETNADYPFLSDGGATARLIASFDWSKTALGAIDTWPQCLKTACSILLRSPVPIVMLWDQCGYMIYNDAYSAFAGGRHPQLLGSKVRDGWPEVADFNDNVMKVGLSGGTLAYRDQELTLHRHGRPEQVWMNLDYSPVLDDAGKPAGVIAIVVETTAKVRAEQHIRGESDRLKRMFEQAPGFMATLSGPDHVFEMANDAYLNLIGHRDIIGRPIGEVLPEVIGQGFVALLDRVYESGERYVGDAAMVQLHDGAGSAPQERFLDFVYEPMIDEAGKIAGIFVQGHDVTKRRNAEISLRDSESRFRLIADSAPVMLWMGDRAGKCIYLNAALRQFWGVEESNVASFDWNGTIHPDDVPTLATTFRRAMGLHISFTVEARYRSAEGLYRLIQTTAQPRFDAAGDFLGMIGVNVDITERRLEEKRRQALIELSDKLRMLEDPAAIAFAAAEILGKTLQVSRAGYGTIDPVAETITIDRDWNAPGIKSLAGVLHFRDYGTYIEDLKRGETVVFADAEKDPRTSATAAALKAISAQSVVNMPVNEQGGFVALLYLNHESPREWTDDELALIRDFADRTRTAVERRRVEQELREFAASLERQVAQRTLELDRVWRNSQDILMVVDTAGIIRAASPAWVTVLGQSASTAIGQPLTGFVWQDDFADAQAAMEAVIGAPEVEGRELRFRHRDGTPRWLTWRMSFEDELIFAYGRDVTAEKEQALTLKHTEEQLRQAQKMEAIGQLTGGIAHDFNNLLQVVSGNLQMLGKDVAGNERAQRRIDSALAGVNRGAKLANQLLAFGRRQPLEPKVVNIGRFVATVGDMLRRTLGETIEVETISGGGLWNTFVDPQQIENALLNLAINSRDAMNGVGKLTLEVGNTFIDEVYARQHAEVEAGQYVMLAVTDTGCGMTPDVLARVFEPFFSTKPVGKGTGLGLSMVYGFVKQSGGHVKIYSEVGQGTTIRIYLPRSLQAEDRLTDLDYGPTSGGSETILVAEDDEAVRATVVDILGDLGYRVLKAKDAASALSVIESGVTVDLLFTDVVMPGPLKSTELARKAKERLPDVEVLFTSGYTENSIVHGGRLDPGVELLSKPYSREALARKIRHLLNNRQQKIMGRRPADDTAPSTPSPEPETLPVEANASTAGPQSYRILVVEDEVLIRMDLVETLEDLGHEITEAGSGEEAVKLAEMGEFDILLTDLGLPKMTGAELARTLIERQSGLGIIFATGNNKMPELPMGKRPVLLRKPFDRRGLEQALAAAAGAPRKQEGAD